MAPCTHHTGPARSLWACTGRDSGAVQGSGLASCLCPSGSYTEGSRTDVTGKKIAGGISACRPGAPLCTHASCRKQAPPHTSPGLLPEAPPWRTLPRATCCQGLCPRHAMGLLRLGGRRPDVPPKPCHGPEDLRAVNAQLRRGNPSRTRSAPRGPPMQRPLGAAVAAAAACARAGAAGVGGARAAGACDSVTEGKLSLTPTFPGGDNVLDLSFDENDGREFSLILFSFSKECRMRESSSIRAHSGPPGTSNEAVRAAQTFQPMAGVPASSLDRPEPSH